MQVFPWQGVKGFVNIQRKKEAWDLPMLYEINKMNHFTDIFTSLPPWDETHLIPVDQVAYILINAGTQDST